VPVDNWASVDTSLVFQMTGVTTYCSVAQIVRSEKQEYTATAVTNRKKDKTGWHVVLRSFETSWSTGPSTRCRTSEDLNFEHRHCESGNNIVNWIMVYFLRLVYDVSDFNKRHVRKRILQENLAIEAGCGLLLLKWWILMVQRKKQDI